VAWPTPDFAHGGIWVSAGTQLAQTGTVVFSNSNNVTFGASQIDPLHYAITVHASATHLANFVQSISAGTTQVTSGQAVISNSGGFSFGVNGQTITADFARVSLYENGLNYDSIAVLGSSAATTNLSFQRLIFWQPISATLANFLIDVTAAGSQQGSLTISLAVYTINGTTASQASSTSSGITWTSGTNVSQTSVYGGISGMRSQSIGLGTWIFTPGDYFFGFMLSVNGPAGTTPSLTMLGSISNRSGLALSQSGGNLNAYFFNGFYSAGTGAFPASLQVSDVVNSFTATASSGSVGQPYFELAGTY
jgi:hypothetical protein